MKNSLGVTFGLLLFIYLLAGCSGTPEAKELETAEVYILMIEAMEEAQSYAFNTELSQSIKFPESVVISEDTQSDRMNIETSSVGRMVQDPLALEMTITVNMPGLADIPLFSEMAESEMKMYIADNRLYMYYSLLDMWISQELDGDFEQISELYNDPMHMLALIGEDGAAEASLDTEERFYVLTFKDTEGSVVKKLMSEVIGELDDNLFGVPLEKEAAKIIDSTRISDFVYQVWVDRESFYAEKVSMTTNISMPTEGDYVELQQTLVTTYKEFNAFTSIVVPAEIINNSVPAEQMQDLSGLSE